MLILVGSTPSQVCSYILTFTRVCVLHASEAWSNTHSENWYQKLALETFSMAGRNQSFRAVTWIIRHDPSVPNEVTHYDRETNQKWIMAKFIYESHRRFHKNMPFEEFIEHLKGMTRYLFWNQQVGDTERIWIAMSR